MPPRQRLQVESGLRAPIATTAASPVDTFTRTDAGQQLSQLAQGLAEFSPSVGRLGATLFEHGKEDSAIAGATAARKLQERGLTYAEATRKGLMPKSANPFYMAGLKEQMGRVSADNWQSDFMASIRGDEHMSKSTDLADFDQFITKHRKEWLSANVGDGRDESFEKGFGHRSDAYTDNLRRQFASQAEKKIGSEADEAHFGELKRHLRDNVLNLNASALAADINALNSALMAQGRSGTDVNKISIEAIAAAALENPIMGDKILSVLEHVKGGSGALRDTRFGSEKTDKVREIIADRLFQNDQREQIKFTKQRDTLTRETISQAVKRLGQDPDADLTDLAAVLSDAGAGDAVGHLTQAQKNMTDLKFKTDPVVKTELYDRIWTGTGSEAVNERTILRSMKEGTLTVEDANWLIDNLERKRSASAKAGRDIYEDAFFQKMMSGTAGTLADKNGIVSGETGDRVRNAHAQLMNEWANLWETGEAQKMTELQRQGWLLETSKSITKLQREGQIMQEFSPAPEAKLTTEPAPVLLLTEQDLSGALRGNLSERVITLMRQRGITKEAAAQFIKDQAALFAKKNNRQPKKAKE